MAQSMMQHLPAGKLHDDFTAWAALNGITISKVRVAAIPNAGIGIVATDNIKAGESLVFTPSSALLTREVIIATLPALPHITHKSRRKRGIHELRTHALIAAGLAGKSYTEQKPWQDVWPSYESFKKYMPLLWNKQRQDLLPPSALLHLNKQKEKFEQDFKKVKSLGFQVSRDAYTYTWVLVNTRTLFYKPSSYTDVARDDCMCLCPFIDYFNHCDHGCPVNWTPEGFTVISDREYKAGEQVFVSYGPHNNDFLLCEYGFILDDNHWDEVNVDNFILPRLKATHKSYLEEEGFLEGYNFDSTTFCFRTQVALRLSFIQLKPNVTSERLLRWRRFIDGEDEEAHEEDAVKQTCRDILGQLKFEADECLMRLEDLREENVSDEHFHIYQTIRMRWEQILNIAKNLEATLV